MENSTEQNGDYNFIRLAFFIYRWRYPLIIVTILAVLCSIIFSSPFFIKPKYKSQVILYPSTTTSISRALLSAPAHQRSDIMEFGEEEHAEQILQILYSDQITFRIIDEFDLMDHYRINPDRKYANTRLIKKYQKNVSFRRTPYKSIEIDVLDEVPEIAAEIANRIAELVDTVKNNVIRRRAIDGLGIVRNELNTREAEIKLRLDSLQKISARGVYNFEDQPTNLYEELSRLRSEHASQSAIVKSIERRGFEKNYLDTMRRYQDALSLVEAGRNRIREIEIELKTLAEIGPASFSITEGLSYELEQLSRLRERYQQAKVDAEQTMSHIFIVDNAYAAEKKSYPVRYLIVLGVLFASIFLSLIFFIIVEKIEYLRDNYTVDQEDNY